MCGKRVKIIKFVKESEITKNSKNNQKIDA